MIAKLGLIGLFGLLGFGAGLGSAQATHLDKTSHAPVAGFELGERLSKPAEPAQAAAAAPLRSESLQADAGFQPIPAERKVRVVYPLTR